ncbi:MAG: NAD(P) transhydrogenase subunit alpha [Actinomycetota bacterium]|nr:NAD(P) transhydrogenase subunit alpha [Actinomycetota bacterium]
MRIGILLERKSGERRVAGSPDSVADLVADGHNVVVETGAGSAAGMPDSRYEEAGATLAPDRQTALGVAGLVLGVNGPTGPGLLAGITENHVLIGLFEPVWQPEPVVELAETGATVFALDLVPRSTRAQAMDVLSSQATVVGYQAILMAANRLPKLVPMLTTAAGTIPPARVVVLGTGVAGLQAIAMARRLGAVVEGFDIRTEALEEIRSLGARTINMPDDVGPADNEAREAALTPHLAEADLVVTAAQIPGAASPTLVTQRMVEAMRPGSLLLDLAAQRGGNCTLTQVDEQVDHQGVTVLGPTDLASGSPATASRMFAANLVALVRHLIADGSLVVNPDDEIASSMLIASQGMVTHPQVREALRSNSGTEIGEGAEL